MRRSFLLGAASLLLMAAGISEAGHCTTWTTSSPEVDTNPLNLPELENGHTYIDNDPCQPNCLFSIWFYFEANGIPGLQREDKVVDDTCHGMISGDVVWCNLLPIALMSRRDPKSAAKGQAVAFVGLGLVTATAFLPTADAC